jgi:hypothetical protein
MCRTHTTVQPVTTGHCNVPDTHTHTHTHTHNSIAGNNRALQSAGHTHTTVQPVTTGHCNVLDTHNSTNTGHSELLGDFNTA